MKAFATVLALGALTGCSTMGAPAGLGMSVSQHAATCSDGGRQIVSELIGVLVGECTSKPDEYVVFTDGTISHIYSADEVANAMLATCPADQFQPCENAIRSEIAQRTETKRAIALDLLSAKNQRIAAALGKIGASLSAMDGYASPASSGFSASQSAPVGTVCFLKGNYTTGANRICEYNCLGSYVPVAQPSVSICALNITR